MRTLKHAWQISKSLSLLFLIFFPSVLVKSQVMNSYVIMLERQNEQLRQTMNQMQARIQQLEVENNILRMTNNDLSTTNQAVARSLPPVTRSLPATTRGIFTSRALSGGQTTNPCRANKGRLVAGGVYNLNYEPLSARGWVIQLFSSRDLCTAIERAEQYVIDLNYQNTFIHVKWVNGVTYYAVLYGIFQDRIGAESMLVNLSNSFGDIRRSKGFVTLL